MKRLTFAVLLLLVVSFLILELTPQPVFGIWQVFLNEHFEEDQQNPQLRWPWFTDQRGGNLRRWHWNPWDPHFRAEGRNRSNYCWGIQNYIYNTHITRDDDQALWCAYTNLNNVNSPRWPEDDDYMNDQNAWVWWGPVDLSQAVNAACIFWIYLDLDHQVRDSVTVAVCNSDAQLTLNGAAFHANVAYGWTSNHRLSNDWVPRIVYFDSLMLDGDSVSYVGDEDFERIWLAFVWQSDNRDIAGKGAFIDDVTYMWDDGLFDIYPVAVLFGYPTDDEDDPVRWSTEYPRYGDEVYLRLNWEVEGVGETPEFTIDCVIDGELFYSEERVGIGDLDSTFTSVTDELWTVPEGDHLIQWMLDVPVDTGGVVAETFEDNNIGEAAFTALWNPPPMFVLTAPDQELMEIPVNHDLQITWTISDSSETDTSFTVGLYATTDTNGFADDPELIFNFIYIDVLEVATGEGSYQWDLNEAYRQRWVYIDSVYYIAAFAVDADPANFITSLAPGSVRILEPDAVGEASPLPLDYGMSSPYPNPFNDQLTLKYSLPLPDYVRLAVYDLEGRLVEVLVDGVMPAGAHTVGWQPEHIAAGVYLLELRTRDRLFHNKAVYMP